MDKVKTLLGAGANLADAVRIALGKTSLAAFALESSINRQNLYSMLSGRLAVTDQVVDAMVARFGGSADDWRDLFSRAQQARTIAV